MTRERGDGTDTTTAATWNTRTLIHIPSFDCAHTHSFVRSFIQSFNSPFHSSHARSFIHIPGRDQETMTDSRLLSPLPRTLFTLRRATLLCSALLLFHISSFETLRQ